MHPALHALMAQFWASARRPQRAIAHYRAALARAPDQAAWWRNLAYLLDQTGQPDTGLDALERAFHLAPDDALTRFNLGFLRHARGEHEAALAHFDACVRLAPHIDRAWYGIGVIHNAAGRHALAVPALERAAQLQPLNPHAALELARAWRAIGAETRVRVEYERVRSFDPAMAQQMRREFGLAEDEGSGG